MQVILVTLAQFAGDHGLGLAHVFDRSLNSNDALKIKAIDIVDTADGDLGIGVLHNSLDRITAFPDNSTDEIIVREDLEGDLTLIRGRCLLLHDIQNLLAGVRAILGIAIDSDGLLQGADVVLAVHVDPGAGHLRDLPYRGSLPADDRAHHVRLDEDT